MRISLLVLSLLVILFSMTARPGAAQDAARAPEPDLALAAARPTLEFGLDLYGKLKQEPQNLLISPYSLATALAMARVGARGNTAREIDKVLHHGPEVTPAAHHALAKALRPGPAKRWSSTIVDAFVLHRANALWVHRDLPVSKAAQDTLTRDFEAPARRVDFEHAPEEARARINRWVASQTRDRIQDIVPAGAIDQETRAVAGAAIYFKATWKQTFSDTHDSDFHRDRGKKVTVPFMRRVGETFYFRDEHVQVAELPYRGQETSMVLVLPRKRHGLSELKRKLSASRVRSWLDDLQNWTVDANVPRFSFTYTAPDLRGVLRELGMKDVFNELTADFTGFLRPIDSEGRFTPHDERLFLSHVLHKAFIAVNDTGTEAAAATTMAASAGRVGRSRQPAQPEPFVADHPFLFLIRHVKTGAVLFLGCVHNPK